MNTKKGKNSFSLLITPITPNNERKPVAPIQKLSYCHNIHFLCGIFLSLQVKYTTFGSRLSIHFILQSSSYYPYVAQVHTRDTLRRFLSDYQGTSRQP